MWILTSKKTGTIYYLLPEKQKHTVGRTNTDLILKNDDSISRSHACLYPSKDHVKVVDTGSKYGTFYNENIENDIAMEKNKQIELKNGERIRFGLMGNEWTISKLNICTLTSALSNEDKNDLEKIMNALDGNITERWIDSCTHLTMSEITVTLKALKALVENIPIVSCNYWKKYLKNLQNGELPPNFNEYLPELAESYLNKDDVSFGLNDKRKTIFQGKIFIFMNKKLSDKYESIIKSGGGQCKDLNRGVSKTFLTKKNVIVIQYTASSQQLSESQLTQQSIKTIDMVTECVTSKGRRLIPDFEIGYAIIYCNTEKYCNPDYDKKSELLPRSLNMNAENTEILAEQTPIVKENAINTNEQLKNALGSIEIPESSICDDYEEEQQLYKSNTNESENLEEEEALNLIEDQIIEDANNVNINIENVKRKRSLLDDDNANNEKETIEKSQPKKLKTAVRFTNRNSQVYNLEDFVEVNQTKSNTGDKISNTDELETTSQNEINPRKRGKIAVIRDDDEDEEDSDNENDLFNFGVPSAKKQKKSSTVNNEITLEKDDDLFDFPQNKNQNKNSTSSSSTSSTSGSNLKAKQIPSLSSSTSIPTGRSYSKTNCIEKRPFAADPRAWLTKSMNRMNLEYNDDDESVKDDNDCIENGIKIEVKKMQLVPSHSLQGQGQDCGSLSIQLNTNKNFKAFIKKQNYKRQTTKAPTVPVTVKISC